MPIVCITCGAENSESALMGDGNSKCHTCGSYLVTANKNIVRPSAIPAGNKKNDNAQPKDLTEILFDKCKVVGAIVIVLECLNIITVGMLPGLIIYEFVKQAFLIFKGNDPLYGDGSMLIMIIINLLWLPSILIAWAIAQLLKIKFKTSILHFLILLILPTVWLLAVCLIVNIILVEPFYPYHWTNH